MLPDWVYDKDDHRFMAEALGEAEQSVEEAYEIAARKLFNIDVDGLRELRDRVLDLLK